MAGFPGSGGGGSTTPPIIVPIQSQLVNAKDISDEIFKAFQVGLNRVMQSKKVAVGMRNMFRLMGTEIEKSMGKAGDSIAKKMTAALNKVPKAAQNAASGSASALNHMVPHSVTASIDRLIQHFDRLDKVIAGLGKPSVSMEHTLAQLNKQLARTTTEAARQQTAAANSALQAQAANANARAKQRVAIIQAMVGQIRALERGLGNVIKFAADIGVRAVRGLANAYRRMGESARAGARAAASAMRSIVTAIATVVRGVARLSTGLASGFARGFGRISSALVGALRRDEGHLRSSLSRRERMVGSSASRQSSLLSRITTPQGIAAIAGGAGIGSILSGGFERFSNLERLQFQYERILGSSTEAAAMLERISEFARTTSFDLPGVAGLATNFLALGQSADQTMENIERLADVTAFTGGTTESLERIQRALGQIVSTGRLQGDELNQLAENLPGINIRQIIADQLGISTAELNKMQEAGELDADTFITAFLNGIDDPRFNGAAVEIAKTLSGRLANLKETFDIFGASLVGLVADPLRNSMEQVTTMLTTIGDFISGEMFKEAENPFEGMKPDANIMFADLPQEMQDILAEKFNWDETNWISAADAAVLWDALNPPDPMMEKLKELLDMVGDFAKGAGGFLAFAGGLKLIAAALGFLISPLTIITGLFGLAGVFWGRLMKSSLKLPSALKILRQNFGHLQTALKETVGLALDFVSAALFGDTEFFTHVGDRVGDFVNMLGAGINNFRIWVEWANETLGTTDGFRKVVDSASQSLQGFLSNFLGLTDAQQAAAQALGGNDFGNIFTAFLDKLENVPVLGPIIRFVRRVVDAISNAVRRVAGFVTDIWHSIFGGGDDPAEVFFGESTEQDTRSAGQRFLDMVEGTFLGPVVRFFRGPFADAVEGVGNFVGGLFNAIFNPEEGTEDQSIITRVADFLAENGLKGLVDWLRGDSLQEAWDNVTGWLAPAFEAISGAISAAWDILEPILEPMTEWVGKVIDAFRDRDFEAFDFGKIAIGAGIGLLAGAVLGGPVGALAGTLIGGAFGAGLGGALKETIGNVWEDAAKPALTALWRSITGWVATTFTAENIKGGADFLLDLMYKAGRLVGGIAGDPKFTAAIVGIGAAAALVIFQFTLGFLVGVTSQIDEWANILGTGMTAAFEAIVPPDVASILGGIFGNPVVTGGLLLLGTGMASWIISGISAGLTTLNAGKVAGGAKGGNRSGLTGALTSLGGFVLRTLGDTFKALFLGAGGLVNMLFGRGGRTGILGTNAEGKLQGLGKSIAIGITAGIGAFTLGAVAGKTGSFGNVLLSILGGAAAGASAGMFIGGGIGAGIGAALGAAISGLGALITSTAEGAAKGKREVKEYADAIEGLAKTAQGAAISDVLLSEFTEESTKTRDTLIALKFDAGAFAREVVLGSESVGEAFAGLFENLIASPDITAEQRGALETFMEKYNAEVERVGAQNIDEDALKGIFQQMEASFPGATEVLAAMGITAEGVGGGFDFMSDEANEARKAVGEMDDKELLANLVTGVEDSIAAFDSAEEAADKLISLFDTPNAVGPTLQDLKDSSQLIVDILDAPGLDTQEKLQAINSLLEEMNSQIEEAKGKLMELIDVQINPPAADIPGRTEDVNRGFRIEITNVQDEINRIQDQMDSGELNWEMGVDLQEESVAGFGDTVSTMLQGAIDAGLITDQASWDAFMANVAAQIQLAVDQGRISEDTAAGLFEVLDGITLTDQMIAIFDEMANDQRVKEAAERAARVIAGFASGAFSFNQMSEQEDTRFGANRVGQAPSLGSTMLGDIDKTDFENNAGAMADTWSQSFIAKGPDMASDVSDTVTKSLNTAGAVGAVVAVTKGYQIGKGASVGVKAAGSLMHASGSNLAVSTGQGIADSAWFAALQAGLMAQQIVNTVRSVFGIASPSKVFIGIGHDIGEGFMQGIADMEGDMMGAITAAVSGAIDEAQATLQAAAAEAGAAIFQAMFPSEMPGGMSLLDITSARAAINQQVAGFGDSAFSGASEAFGNQTDGALGAAQLAIQTMIHDARLGFGDVAADVRAAFAHQTELAEWTANMAQLEKDRASGALGIKAYNEAVAEQQKLRNADLITVEQYNDAITELNKKLRAGILNQEAYNDALSDLESSKPEPLTREELDLIRTGRGSLDPRTVAGEANIEVINSALQSIADWAQAALEAGTPIDEVAAKVNGYVASLVKQAKIAGLSVAEVNKLVEAMGLMPNQIKKWVDGLTSLNASTLEGQANIQMINEQLGAIRDYGVSLLEAGFSASQVEGELKKLRDEFIKQATAFGFSAKEINKLVDAAGLSDDALAAFIKEMQAFATEAANAEKAAAAAAQAAADRAAAEKLAADERAAAATTPLGRPAVENLNIYIPYGDPEAVGMAAANAIAYNSLTSW